MEHKFMKLYVNGEWTGNADRTIRVNGEVHNLDDYAKAHGIVLPDAKKSHKSHKKINTVVEQHEVIEEEDYGDLDIQDDPADTESD